MFRKLQVRFGEGLIKKVYVFNFKLRSKITNIITR